MEDRMTYYIPNDLLFVKCHDDTGNILYWLYDEDSFSDTFPCSLLALDINREERHSFDDPAKLINLELEGKIKIINNDLIKGIKIMDSTSNFITFSDPRLENSRIIIKCCSFLKFLQNAEKFNIKNGEIISKCRYATDKKGYFHIITSSKNKNFNCMRCAN